MGVLTDESRLLELRVELWKARSRVKLNHLEQMLSAPSDGPRAAAWRSKWIKRAVKAVESREAALKSREAWLKVYAEHLNELKKKLGSVVEKASGNSEEPGKHKAGSASSSA